MATPPPCPWSECPGPFSLKRDPRRRRTSRRRESRSGRNLGRDNGLRRLAGGQCEGLPEPIEGPLAGLAGGLVGEAEALRLLLQGDAVGGPAHEVPVAGEKGVEDPRHEEDPL